MDIKLMCFGYVFINGYKIFQILEIIHLNTISFSYN